MSARIQLYKVKASRLFRKGVAVIKSRLSGGPTGSADNVFGDVVESEVIDKDILYKSTGVVMISGTAIGISHIAAASAKYGSKVSTKFMLAGGMITGVIIAGIWYKCIDAAHEDVSEEDILVMFDMINNAGIGNIEEGGDTAKAIDILHTVVTGKVSESKPIDVWEDEDADDESDDEDPFESKKINRSSTSDLRIGKSLKENTESTRKSFIPDDDIDEDFNDVTEGSREPWMDI